MALIARPSLGLAAALALAVAAMPAHSAEKLASASRCRSLLVHADRDRHPDRNLRQERPRRRIDRLPWRRSEAAGARPARSTSWSGPARRWPSSSRARDQGIAARPAAAVDVHRCAPRCAKSPPTQGQEDRRVDGGLADLWLVSRTADLQGWGRRASRRADGGDAGADRGAQRGDIDGIVMDLATAFPWKSARGAHHCAFDTLKDFLIT